MNKKILLYTFGGIALIAVLAFLALGIEGIYKATIDTDCFQTIRYTNTTNPADAYIGNFCNITVMNQSNFATVVNNVNMTNQSNGFHQYNCTGLANGDYLGLIECNATAGDYNYVTLEFVIGDETSHILTNGSAILNETQIEKAVWFNDDYAHSCNIAP